MPYIIETRRTSALTESHPKFAPLMLTRTAVATLDEARDYTFNARVNDDGQIEPLPESGGTVGPVPDGTVIEVRPMTYEDIDSIPDGAQLLADGDSAELIAAFNAA